MLDRMLTSLTEMTNEYKVVDLKRETTTETKRHLF